MGLFVTEAFSEGTNHLDFRLLFLDL